MTTANTAKLLEYLKTGQLMVHLNNAEEFLKKLQEHAGHLQVLIKNGEDFIAKTKQLVGPLQKSADGLGLLLGFLGRGRL